MLLRFLRLALGTTLGQIVTAILALFAFWQVDRNVQYRSGVAAGESKVIQESKQKSKENAAKSKQAHDAARKPGAFERLRSDPLVCSRCK